MSSVFEPFITSIKCSNIDELAEAARHWTEEYSQLEAGILKTDLHIAQLGGIQFGLQKWNQSIGVRGHSPPKTLSVAISLDCKGSVIWQGHQLHQNHLMLSHSSEEHALTGLGQTELCVISIDQETLLKEADAIKRSKVESILEGKLHLICPDLWRLTAVKNYLQDLWRLVGTASQQALDPQMQILIREDFIPLFLNLLASNDSKNEIVHPSKRSIVAKKAEEFIASHLQKPLTLRDLYEHLQVSERTLRYSFQEGLGMSPMAYLKVQRLNGVRRELKAGAIEEGKVSQIALRWGFWHMGQFSQDYRKLFGESPSQTLAKLSAF